MAVAKSLDILQINPLKLNKMIYLLNENGFTSNEIMKTRTRPFFQNNRYIELNYYFKGYFK
jgi:hypothetical protein